MDRIGHDHTEPGHAPGHRHDSHAGHAKRPAVVLHVGGLYRASEKAVVEAALRRRPGVLSVEANPVAQTATVTYDARRTSVAELQRWVQECGYHCAGQSVPTHMCDPMAEPDPPPPAHGAHVGAAVAAPTPTVDHRPTRYTVEPRPKPGTFGRCW